MTQKQAITNTYDVIIVGAGPAGTSCALRLAESGLKIGLLDKATFPRDKICGDALSVDVINQLPMLAGSLQDAFERSENKMPSYGVRIFSPDHSCLDIPFIYKGKKSCGFISPRLNFDNILFQQAKQQPGIGIHENCNVIAVERNKDAATVTTNKGIFSAPIVIGSDGAHSIVSKCLGDVPVERKHYSAGLRVYYENVDSFHEEGFIELHFFKDILPGYLWIFPLAGNKANVGIGMLSSVVSRKKINLKEVLERLIKTHPSLQQRFRNATPLETVKGFGLPLGSKKRTISGDRFLLTGDAAALIDPFTGEGIGNAIRSGRVAAEHIMACFRADDFSAAFNRQYDKEIYRRMWKEFRISSTLQKLVKYPRFFNFVVKKAGESKYLQRFFIEALSEAEKKKKILWKPSFYYGIFFKS